MRAGLSRVVGAMQGVDRGATVRAGNWIGDDWAASLAPSSLRMTQLTSLDLGGTLMRIGGCCAVSGCMRTPEVRRCCTLWAGVVACRAVAGGGICEVQAEGRQCVQAV